MDHRYTELSRLKADKDVWLVRDRLDGSLCIRKRVRNYDISVYRKLQMLQILDGTDLAEEYRIAPFPLMSMEEYADLIVESVSILPRNTVIHRMTGDGPRRLLIAPLWSLDKKQVLNTINRKIKNSQM